MADDTKMTDEEWWAYIGELFPGEINGIQRPIAPILADREYAINMPEWIRMDPLRYDLINAVLRQLLSNDERCREWINELMDALAKQDFNLATQKIKGLMSAADKAKVDGMQSGAEINQNAISNIKAGGATVAATEKTDTVEVAAGKNIEVTVKGKVITIDTKNIADGAEVNQNAFSTVQVGTTKINAAAKTDTLTIAAGKNILVSADTSNKKITISADENSGESIGHIGLTLSNIPEGCLTLDTGAVVSRLTYPELWEFVQSSRNLLPIVTESQWQTMASSQTSVAAFSTGDGSTTFRLPKLIGWMKGGAQAQVGAALEAGLPNVTGTFDGSGGTYTGLFTTTQQLYKGGGGGTGSANIMEYSFDASKSNAIYGNSTTVQPAGVTGVYYIRAFHGAVNQGNVDLTELANELIHKVNIGDIGATLIASSLVQNGWVKFSNGLLIQWGYGPILPRYDVSTIVPFPISFTKFAFATVGTDGMSDDHFFISTAVSTTGVTVFHETATKNENANIRPSFIAIGV